MSNQPARNYGLLTDLDWLDHYVKTVMAKGLKLGFDVETGYHGPDRAKGSLLVDWDRQFVCGFSISHHPLFARYVPLHHDCGGNVSDPAQAWEIMKPILTQGELVIHHKKFERRNVQKAAGYIIGSDGGTVWDSMLDSYVLNEFGLNVETKDGRTLPPTRAAMALKDLTKILFDYDQPKIETLFPGYTQKQLDALRFNVLELTPQVIAYCCDDAAYCLALEANYGHRAAEERKTMRRVEHAISDIMADVEKHGVYIDWEGMAVALAQAKSFDPKMQKAVKEGLGELAGRDLTALNLGSSQQMKALLYRDIGFKTTRQTKSGKDAEGKEAWERMSTDAIAMEGLSKEHPEIKKLLEYREVQNLSRRLQKWLTEFRYAVDDRVHANYNQVTVGSGRFAANDPPIQQCPKEWRWCLDPYVDVWKYDEETETYPEWDEVVAAGENGKDYWTGNFRDFIAAAPGNYLLTYDYSQIELRVLAGVTQEPALLKAFADGIDVHTMTAAQMLGKKPDKIDKKTERPIGKTMNFALLYGMGAKSLSERLAVTLEQAKEMYAQYFAAFTRIASWQSSVTIRGRRDGYVTTQWGRKYTVWELKSDNKAIQSKADRVFTNVPIQGGAADYMKMAMIRAHKVLVDRGWWMDKVTIIMNQHDSLSFECSNELNPAEVRAVLEEAVVFEVPRYPVIVADWELGQRWGSSTPWKSGLIPVWDGQQWKLTPGEEPVAVPNIEVSQVDDAQTGVETVDDEIVESEVPQGKTIIVTTSTVTREALQGLLEFLAARPGEEETWLESTQAPPLRLGRSSLSKVDVGHVSLLLDGASLKREASQADVEAIASLL